MPLSFNEFVNNKVMQLLEHLDADPKILGQIALKSDGHRAVTAEYNGMPLLVFISSYGGMPGHGENSWRVRIADHNSEGKLVPVDLKPDILNPFGSKFLSVGHDKLPTMEFLQMAFSGLLKFLIENKPNAVDIDLMRKGLFQKFTGQGLFKKPLDLPNMPRYGGEETQEVDEKHNEKVQDQMLFNKRFDAGITKVLSEASKATGQQYKVSGSDLIVTQKGLNVTRAGGYNTDGNYITDKNLAPRSQEFKDAKNKVVSDIYKQRRDNLKANRSEFENLGF